MVSSDFCAACCVISLLLRVTWSDLGEKRPRSVSAKDVLASFVHQSLLKREEEGNEK